MSGRGAGGHPSSGVPYGCLPPFLPGSASLVEQLDRPIMVVLRDGRHLLGTLRSFDQFSNMVMEDVVERRIVAMGAGAGAGTGAGTGGKEAEPTRSYYTDVPLGLFMVRGDSMVLLGEVDDRHLAPREADGDGEGEGGGGSDVVAGSANGKAPMQKVSLEQFEKLVGAKRQIEEAGGAAVADLCWEFDMDLVV